MEINFNLHWIYQMHSMLFGSLKKTGPFYPMVFSLFLRDGFVKIEPYRHTIMILLPKVGKYVVEK